MHAISNLRWHQHPLQGHAALSEVMRGRGKDAAALAPRAAVLLTEQVECADGLRVRLHLWRRDALTGALELDERLRIKKADMVMGLVVGLPAASLLKQPLHRFLDIPKGQSWEQVMKVKARVGGLKSGARGVLSQQAFEGRHPDGGTMRLVVQGVPMSDGLGGSKTRIEASVHPDTSFKGAHANLFVALGLESAKGAGGSSSRSGESSDDNDNDARSHGDGEEGYGGGALTQQRLRAATSGLLDDLEPDDAAHEMKVDSDGDENEGGEGEAAPPSKPSEFVARWVRTVSNQMSSEVGGEFE